MRVVREYKEPKGKYVSVELLVNDRCIIERLSITGDFFAFPQELIDEITLRSRGHNLINEKIDNLVVRILEGVEILGIRRDMLKNIILGVLREGRSRCAKKS